MKVRWSPAVVKPYKLETRGYRVTLIDTRAGAESEELMLLGVAWSYRPHGSEDRQWIFKPAGSLRTLYKWSLYDLKEAVNNRIIKTIREAWRIEK